MQNLHHQSEGFPVKLDLLLDALLETKPHFILALWNNSLVVRRNMKITDNTIAITMASLFQKSKEEVSEEIIFHTEEAMISVTQALLTTLFDYNPTAAIGFLKKLLADMERVAETK